MAEHEDSSRNIDETPISPSRPNPGRKNSLEYHLSHRPERQELVDSMLRRRWPSSDNPLLPTSCVDGF
jgi:hypothetical protein